MKLLILGISGSGKSSVSEELAKKYKLDLIEADDEVEKANAGVWPEGNDLLIDQIFEVTNKKVIDMDNLLYVISWLSKKRITDFYKKGFLIIEMHADKDVLIKRKSERDGWNEKREKRFEKTFEGYQESILAIDMLKYYVLSIDTTNLNQEETFQKIAAFVDKRI